MTRKSLVLIMACLVTLLIAAPAMAAADAPPAAPPAGHAMGPHGDMGPGMGPGMMGGGMMGGGMMGVPPEKQDAVRKIQNDYKDRMFTLMQDLRAKHAELNAIMLQAQPDTNKAKATAGDIANLIKELLNQKIDMHARITKETGVRLPIGPAHGGMMMGGGMGGGCPMMGGDMGEHDGH